MRHVQGKYVLIVLLFVLFVTPSQSYAQTASGNAATRSVQVKGRIGETDDKLDEEQLDSDAVGDDGRTKIVADVSAINKGSLPKTGSEQAKIASIAGVFLLVISFYLLSNRELKKN